jgi:protein arginine N-methyltransferase 1
MSEINMLGQFIPLIYHYNMLSDETRMGAFKEAIADVVKPGHTVLKLGGGTGVLSHMAAQAGAQVLCVERNPEMVGEAQRILKMNAACGHVA